MIDKTCLQDVMLRFGDKYNEMEKVLRTWEAGEPASRDLLRLKTMPGRLFIEPTNRCNRNCEYCAHSSMERDYSMLSLEDFRRAIRDLPAGTYITMTGNGEPLLNSNIYTMIAEARAKGLLVGLICNGTVLTEKNARKLIEAGPNRVQISFDSIDKAVFNQSYGNPKGACRFESVVCKVLNFIRLERTEYKKGIFITIAMVMTENVKSKAEETRAFWEKMPLDNLYEGPLLSLQTYAGTSEENSTLKEDWKICANPWTSMKINADGTVNACIQDFSNRYIIGSVREQSLTEMMNSENALALREALYNNDSEFCSKIGYNCQQCNAWTSEAKHDLCGYMQNSFPMTYGLMVAEACAVGDREPEKIKHLEMTLAKLKEEYGVTL
ncbi:radical SAM/SPASM domain-containing protein [Pseudodesulfovibrio piezophilus]|uniref:Radical SAM core domain-containing protein n=1 Tax=Pseudodesulfovibrio piezophilus (strain DSM 21447 / JCM 15486 / C1TLV30) TaxID=1322246 RepID=M1WRY4_PSEP2|nr:radical SAM/SPASM domain-containing protein [Pseudodesulfovibrio piezophilus]CCH48602.1 conserved protein of unknown function [Pseudodesulfovibrio piezophilus C1TLV30]